MKWRRLIGMSLTAMISIHGGLTLVYLTLRGVDGESSSVLRVFLFGCLTILIIPFARCDFKTVIQLALYAKLILATCWYLYEDGWIVPEAFLSGLIASSSFYFAMGEIAATKNMKLSSAFYLLIVNLQALFWYSILSWAATAEVKECLILVYGIATVLPALYLGFAAGGNHAQVATIKELIVSIRSLPIFKLVCYMVAVLSVNYFNLCIGAWGVGEGRPGWRGVIGLTTVYIVGVLSSMFILSKASIKGCALLFWGMLSLCITCGVMGISAINESWLLASCVYGLGVSSTIIMSVIVENLSMRKDFLGRVLVISLLSFMQIFLLLIVDAINGLGASLVNPWIAISVVCGVLLSLKAGVPWLKGVKV